MTYKETDGEAKQIVSHNHHNNQQAAHQQSVCIMRNDDAHHQCNGYRGECRQVGCDATGQLRKETLAEQTTMGAMTT